MVESSGIAGPVQTLMAMTARMGALLAVASHQCGKQNIPVGWLKHRTMGPSRCMSLATHCAPTQYILLIFGTIWCILRVTAQLSSCPTLRRAVETHTRPISHFYLNYTAFACINTCEWPSVTRASTLPASMGTLQRAGSVAACRICLPKSSYNLRN